MSETMGMKCLRCGKTFGIPETDMQIIGYTKYSYQADDFSYYVELFVYDNKGLSIINVNTY